jgi:hypothetical protein
MKAYLGDSVYVETDSTVRGALILTTFNGITESNRIVLEPEVLENFLSLIELSKRPELKGLDTVMGLGPGPVFNGDK